MSAIALAAVIVAAAAAALRWLAVAVLAGLLGSFGRPIGAVISAAALLIGPFGLSLLGTAPGPVAWTRRLRTLAGIHALLFAALVGVGFILGEPMVAGVIGAAF